MDLIRKPPALPARPHDGNKGTFGRVLVVGGTDGMLGAPAMAGRAALKLGAGLVEIAVPKSILQAALTITPELIGIGLDTGVSDELIESGKKSGVIVIGPGLGKSADARARLQKLMSLGKPCVVDADALNMISDGESWPDWFTGTGILTPHPGEMKRLGKLIGVESVANRRCGANRSRDAGGRGVQAGGGAQGIAHGRHRFQPGLRQLDRQQCAGQGGHRRCAEWHVGMSAGADGRPVSGGVRCGASARPGRGNRG